MNITGGKFSNLSVEGGVANITGGTYENADGCGINVSGGTASISNVICQNNKWQGLQVDWTGIVTKIENSKFINNGVCCIIFHYGDADKKYESEFVLNNVQSYDNTEQAAHFDGGKLTITGRDSRFESSADYYQSIYFEKEGTLTIEDGVVEGGRNAIDIVDENAVVKITGGKVKAGANYSALECSKASGQIQISGGEIIGTIKGGNVVIGKDFSITGSIDLSKLGSCIYLSDNLTNQLELQCHGRVNVIILKNKDGAVDYVSSNYGKFTLKDLPGYKIDSTGMVVQVAE